MSLRTNISGHSQNSSDYMPAHSLSGYSYALRIFGSTVRCARCAALLMQSKSSCVHMYIYSPNIHVLLHIIYILSYIYYPIHLYYIIYMAGTPDVALVDLMLQQHLGRAVNNPHMSAYISIRQRIVPLAWISRVISQGSYVYAALSY